MYQQVWLLLLLLLLLFVLTITSSAGNIAGHDHYDKTCKMTKNSIVAQGKNNNGDFHILVKPIAISSHNTVCIIKKYFKSSGKIQFFSLLFIKK